jgi:hypothetical protein
VNLDPATLAIGAAVGGGVGSLAALVVLALIIRYVFGLWRDFDQLRTQALTELRSQNADLHRRIDQLEKRLDSAP